MSAQLKNRTISWVSKTFFANNVYRVRNGLNKGLLRAGGLGWLPLEQSNPELDFWRSLDFTGKVVYDIGAFHGLLTLYFARSAEQVVAWEPISFNRARLIRNLELNQFGHVTIRPYALGAVPATLEFRYDEGSAGTATSDPSLQRGTHTETIEIRTLDAESGIPDPDFIKVDTEGYELDVLRGASRVLGNHPELFLEMHGADPVDKRRRVEAIVSFLWETGYRNLLHVESKTPLDPDNAHLAAQGHIYGKAGSPAHGNQ